MKMIKGLITSAAILLSFALFTSCADNEGYSLDAWKVSIATVNPTGENTYTLTLDDGTSLLPANTNIQSYKPKSNQRAMVNYTVLSDAFQGYDHAIKVNDIINILTKNITTLTPETTDSLGNDPLYIKEYWIGDGYLNIEFGFPYSYGAEKHFINMAKNDTIGKPDYYELRHNAYGDLNGPISSGFVAFNLSSLQKEELSSVEFTLKVKTFEGDKEVNIKYDWGVPGISKVPASLATVIPVSITEVR